jgi:hypothetical protein
MEHLKTLLLTPSAGRTNPLHPPVTLDAFVPHCLQWHGQSNQTLMATVKEHVISCLTDIGKEEYVSILNQPWTG